MPSTFVDANRGPSCIGPIRQHQRGQPEISRSSSSGFASTSGQTEDWVAPDARPASTGHLKFEAHEQLAGTEFGVMSFPRLASTTAYRMASNRIASALQRHPGHSGDLEKERSQSRCRPPQRAEPARISNRVATSEKVQRATGAPRPRTDLLQIYIEEDGSPTADVLRHDDNALGNHLVRAALASTDARSSTAP